MEISGGGGFGATAMAVMATDPSDPSGNKLVVSKIVITNPGVGYTGAPTVSLVGGGGNGATLGTAVTAANVSGGLTKTGAGTLSLYGQNTFTGPTVVNNGTLQVGIVHQAMSANYGGTGNRNDAYSIGRDITVAAGSQVIVTQLGAFDSGGAPLANAHNVRITNVATTTDVATATVPAGGGTLSNGFAFVPISPVTLLPGTYRISADTGVDAWADFGLTSFDPGNGAITYGNSYYGGTGSMPTTGWGRQ